MRNGVFRHRIVLLLIVIIIACLCAGCGTASQTEEEGQTAPNTQTEETLQPDRVCDSKDEVAEYLFLYDELPSNYITKDEARRLGWDGGSVEEYAPGKCIGGDRYGNYERNLPEGDYKECDIDTLGKESRGAKRLVYSEDDIYYTDDHYETFVQLYDKDGKL